MKFSFGVLLLRLLWRPLGKGVEKALIELGPRAIEDGMRQQIEKWSDKTINQGIKDIKEGNYCGLEDWVASFKRAGITLNMILQWFEDEKFLREHRQKHHPEEIRQGN